MSAVERRTGLDRPRAEAVTASVLGCLRELVPEEVADVAAGLPLEIRDLWVGAGPVEG